MFLSPIFPYMLKTKTDRQISERITLISGTFQRTEISPIFLIFNNGGDNFWLAWLEFYGTPKQFHTSSIVPPKTRYAIFSCR